MNKTLKEEYLKIGGNYIDSIEEVASKTAEHIGEFDYLVVYRFEEAGDMGRFIKAVSKLQLTDRPQSNSSVKCSERCDWPNCTKEDCVAKSSSEGQQELTEFLKWMRSEKLDALKGYQETTDELQHAVYATENMIYGIVINKLEKVLSNLLNRTPNDAVCDTTGDPSSSVADNQKDLKV
jgi:hypothetical protein